MTAPPGVSVAALIYDIQEDFEARLDRLGFELDLRIDQRILDVRGDRTALHEEGFGEVETLPLLESFIRHFLAWMNTWQDDGFDQVCAAWIARRIRL